MKTLTKLLIAGILILSFTGCEKTQKKILDYKADVLGTERTVNVYSFDGKQVKSYTDSDVQFDTSNGGISIWLGDSNRKVWTNMNVVIEDK